MNKMNIASALDIKSWYIESRVTISDAKKFILFSFVVYALGIIVGYSYLNDVQVIRDEFIELYENYHDRSYFIFVSKIFIHNAVVAYISMRLGILFGLLPAISGMASGISIGWLFANTKSLHWLKLLLILAPHGLFEMPAMFIAWGIGFWRCKMLFVPNYEKVSKENVRKIHKIFVTLILPLLVLAAVIEGRPLFFK